MYVCLCQGVSDHDIHDAIREGAQTVEAVARCTGAGTRCKSCLPTIATLVDRACKDDGPCKRRSLSVLPSAA